MKEGLSRMKAKASEGLHRWEERSRDLITNFMGLFGRDGRIVSELILIPLDGMTSHIHYEMLARLPITWMIVW